MINIIILATIIYIYKRNKSLNTKEEARGIVKYIDKYKTRVDIVDMHKTEIGIMITCDFKHNIEIGDIVSVNYNSTTLEGKINNILENNLVNRGNE